MPLNAIATLVAGLSRDAGDVQTLRSDPAALATQYGLGGQSVRALTSADRFFKTEKPIMQRSPIAAAAVRTTPQVAVGAQRMAAKAPLAASADTGTLLPGPNTGTFTASGGTASGSATGISPSPSPTSPAPGAQPGPAIAPAPRTSPQPPVPGPMVAPQRYPTTPTGPVHIPWPPAGIPSPLPPAPAYAPTSALPQLPRHPGTGQCCCSCEASVVAITAMVNATAQAALTAITAIAHQQRG
jgi:hypothetical protein